VKTAAPPSRFTWTRGLAASFFACWFLASASARGADAPRYSLTLVDSGRADGWVMPRGVNDRGEIAGTLVLNGGGGGPVLWTPAGGVTRLGDFTGGTATDGLGIAINNSTQIAGAVFGRAAFWPRPAKAIALGPVPSAANAINDAGMVVGFEASPTGADGRAFRRLADGTFEYLSAPGLTETVALAVNASGHVSGLSRTNPFVWAPDGTVTTLRGLGGGSVFGQAHGINDQNWVAGVQLINGLTSHALLWRPGEDPLDIGGLPGRTDSVAESINNHGVIVGSSVVGGLARAFVWTEEEGALPLTSLLDASGRGWVLTNPFDINDRGQIVGQGIYQGRQQGFLLTPVPEPSAGFLLVAGAAVAALRRRRGAQRAALM